MPSFIASYLCPKVGASGLLVVAILYAALAYMKSASAMGEGLVILSLLGVSLVCRCIV